MISHFSLHKCPSEPQTKLRLASALELVDPRQHILEHMTVRDPIEPAAHRKIGDGRLLLAEQLNRLCRNLDISEQPDVTDIIDPDLLDHLLLVPDLEYLIAPTHMQSRRVQIKRTPVIPRGNQSPDFCGILLRPGRGLLFDRADG